MRPLKNTFLFKGTLSYLMVSGMLISALPAQAQVSQVPLLLGGGSVPGNLALVPSVEFPTVISVANLGAYNHASNYAGYFDSEKCYEYVKETFDHVFFGTIKGDDGGGYFTPTRFARNCTNAAEWSGNYLNWATTQTIDPFRKALTGGYRSVDTTSKTILEKATRAGSNSYFPYRFITSNTNRVTPFTTPQVESTVTEGNNYQKNKTVRIRTWNQHGPITTDYYSVRVEVCKNESLRESNCKQYGNNWKPEGLLQQYADSIRYSAFSYLNENGNQRNGGVLRAQQAYIGPITRTPGTTGEQVNSLVEWDTSTGILKPNPHNDSTGNSGVINYINKFGELTNSHKSNDPVSELYYTAIRYFKNQGNISAYSNITNDSQRDKFPVITNWEDPIQYACQKNVILGIGDVYTHEDRDLPPTGVGETLDIASWTKAVFDLEGITASPTGQFTGRGNSAHIAGLAYYANTTDIRPGDAKPGKQTVSTHWVDVRENQYLEPKNRNQYWLAAKYGGFKVPNNYTRGTALQESWWRTTAEILDSNDPRPDNFYVASDAENMVKSLELAFAQISEEMQSTLNTLASNSTRLETDTAVFQSSLNSRHWSGDLVAKKVDTSGNVSDTESWSVADRLNAVTPSSRKIFTSSPLAEAANSEHGLIATSALNFDWDLLTTEQQQQLMTDAEITANNDSVAQQRLQYLRGDRSLERTNTDQSQPFRQRANRLGDIVNSDPQYIGKQNYGYSLLRGSDWTTARNAYAAFQASKASRTEMLVFGANDGMLHLVKAGVGESDDGGAELFAFIPNSVFANLRSLANPNYSHRYYVDGSPLVADAWMGNGWKTLVAGTTGAGGNSVFLLDVTSTSNMGASNFLWEFSHPDMGHTIGQPAIVALPSGKFAVVVTSGYQNSATTSAKVWFLDVNDGSVLNTITIETEGSLGAPLLADINSDMVADRLYVGDTLGNLWRYDLNENGSASNPFNSSPLFVATDGSNRQPITAPLTSAFDEKGRHMVLFGTGSFMNVGDNEVPSSPQVQSFYGILDVSAPVSRSDLLEQEILVESTLNSVQARAISENSMGNEHKGWYLDLAWTAGEGATGAQGERVVSKATVRGERVLFTSMIPSSDPCASGGTSWITVLNLSSGSRLNYVYFDTNKDGDLDDGDTLTDPDGNPLPPSGISDPSDGATKSTAPLYSWLCYAGSGGTAKCIKVAASQLKGRQSWQEER